MKELLIKKHAPAEISESFWPESVLKSLTTADHNLIVGPPGTGKSSTIQAYLKEHGFSFIYLNGSDNRGLDAVRNTIQTYIDYDTVGGSENRAVLIDEIDGFTPAAFNALRSVMEHANGVRFFATANNGRVIPAPIKSRFNVTEIDVNNTEFKQKWLLRVQKILELEDVSFNKDDKMALALKSIYPDFRKACTLLSQAINDDNVLDTKVLTKLANNNDVVTDEEATFKWLMGSTPDNIYHTLRSLSSYNEIMQTFASPFINWLQSKFDAHKWSEVAFRISAAYSQHMLQYQAAPDQLLVTYSYLLTIRGYVLQASTK